MVRTFILDVTASISASALGDVSMAGFQLTYSTMFAAPPELHELFDRALVRVGQAQGREHALFIGQPESLAPVMQHLFHF
jgi:hypothetical protein